MIVRYFLFGRRSPNDRQHSIVLAAAYEINLDLYFLGQYGVLPLILWRAPSDMITLTTPYPGRNHTQILFCVDDVNEMFVS